METLGRIVVLVRDFDEAARFYHEKLGLSILFDAGEDEGRFLHLGFKQGGVWLLLARTEAAQARVGNQTGGEPVGVIYTSDVRAEHTRLVSNGVRVDGEVKTDEGSAWCRFFDLYGNQWVLVQLIG